MSDLLARAAERAESEPSLMAPVLAAYRRRHRLDAPALAAFLGCTVARLYGLALCRRPVLDRPDLEAAVASLAAYIGCDAGRLLTMLREAQAE